jgi:hypothetical protein
MQYLIYSRSRERDTAEAEWDEVKRYGIYGTGLMALSLGWGCFG